MQSIDTRVRQVVHRCSDVVSVLLERPASYRFAAGQWFRLAIEIEGGRTDVRTFSHAAAPADDWVEATTRVSESAFKRALVRLTPGDAVSVTPAAGRLHLPKDCERLAVLVGGTGITPVRSLLRDAVQTDRRFAEAVVFYGNRDATCEPYLDELERMGPIGVRVVRVLEHPHDDWGGESGYITPALVTRHADVLDGRPVLVAGPPMMVEAMERVLDDLGVAEEHRLVESFGPRARSQG